MAGALGRDGDRLAATAGFVVSGLALAAGLGLDWTAAAAGFGVPSPVGAVIATAGLVAFALRRYGVVGRRGAGVAGVAHAALGWYAVYALVGPVLAGGETGRVGPGLWLALGLGVAGVGVAYADWTRMPDDAFTRRGVHAAVASAVGLAGLLVGNLLGVVPVVAGDLPAMWRFALVTLLFGVGLAVVAGFFLAVTDYGAAYLDVAVPDRRGAIYTVGGVAAIFALLVGLGVLSNALGLGGAESSLVDRARENPEILLVLVPLSWLVIGVGEELLFRNVVQKYLAEAYSPAGAVLLGCVVFTLMHVPTYFSPDAVAMFSTLVRLFLLSLVLGVAYERTRNVVVPVLIHGTFDAVQFAALYVMLTGGVESLV
jgi:membrane protease YdiL (CAAX protease family)